MASAENTSSKAILSSKHWWYIIPAFLLIGLFLIIYFNYSSQFSFAKIANGFTSEFFIFLIIGVFAQLVDGTLGMGYGATSTSFLMSFGVPPAVSSTAVHV
jgi:hypothetical protein